MVISPFPCFFRAVTGYAVTYDGNGSDGGTVPVDGSSPYLEAATVTVLGNTGTLSKTGYTFNDWNTAADGSGTARAPAAEFAMPAAAVTLYAQWVEDAPAGDFLVADAGSGAYNGSYAEDGTHNSKPAYTDGYHWIYFESFNLTWTIADTKGGTVVYRTATFYGNPATPASDTWVTGTGTAPAPTVTAE